MRVFVFLAVTAATALALVGCMSQEVERYGAIDQTSKTITAPPGSIGLLGGFKRVLAANGWQVVAASGPARYRLVASSAQIDLCVIGGGAYTFNVSIVDNRSAAEVVAMSGSGCESVVLRKFAEALR